MSFKKAMSAVMAVTTVASFASISALAAGRPTVSPVDSTPTGSTSTIGINYGALKVYNGDGELKNSTNFTVNTNGTLSIETVTPNATLYIPIYSANDSANSDIFGSGNWYVSNDSNLRMFSGDLTNKDLYTFNAKKDTNGSLVKSITVESEKVLDDVGGTTQGRSDYLKIVLNDNTMTSEKKFEGTISFKAKKSAYGTSSSTLGKYTTGTKVRSGDKVEFKISMWVNNEKVTGSDGSASTGDRVFFDPESNETNTFVWGDDRAAIKFDANDDASKFYCRLSTASIQDVYTTYGDPVGADLWFYDFVGNQTIPSTSRATVTLGIPWDDDETSPAPEDCYVYSIDADGMLTDVTELFKYSTDDEEIEGWSIKTRTLGTYVLSDTELDTATLDEEVGEPEELPSDVIVAPDTDKEIPVTGSSDMVNVAVVAAVLSLAAAGAVAFKKASK